jgi:spore coat protein U-like protein
MNYFRNKLLVIVLGFSVLNPIKAETTNATFQVNSTAEPVCSLTLSGDMTFAKFSPSSTGPGGQNSPLINLNILCSKNISYSISADRGLHNSNGATGVQGCATRKLMNTTDPNEFLDYISSYKTTTLSAGMPLDGCAASFYQNTGSGSQQTIIVYGSLSTRQNVKPGNYSDIINFTINY